METSCRGLGDPSYDVVEPVAHHDDHILHTRFIEDFGGRPVTGYQNVEPELSIIIPTRNRSGALSECVRRIHDEAARAEKLVETVVVDTSSAPWLPPVIDPPWMRLTYHYEGDIPFSMDRSRNRGLMLATSSIVAYIDDDCFVLPGWLNAIIEPYKDPDVVAVGGRIIYHPWVLPRYGEPVACLDVDRDEIWGEWDRIVDGLVVVPHLPGGNFSVRRCEALRVGGFDTNYTGSANMEETDFFWRLARLPGRILYTSQAVVEHRAFPRTDGIERSSTNYIYRRSTVRNRLYFLRKTGRSQGVWRSVRRQSRDTLAFTAKLLWDAVVFAVASLVGLWQGVWSPIPTGSGEPVPRSTLEDVSLHTQDEG